MAMVDWAVTVHGRTEDELRQSARELLATFLEVDGGHPILDKIDLQVTGTLTQPMQGDDVLDYGATASAKIEDWS